MLATALIQLPVADPGLPIGGVNLLGGAFTGPLGGANAQVSLI